VAFAGWLAVGAAAEWRDQIEPVKNEVPVVVRSQPWKNVTEEQVASIDLNQIPPDDGLVTPMAGADQAPSDAVDMKLAEMEGALPHWQPGYVEDRVQRARNLLCVAALPDLMQNPVERWAPHLVLRKLESEYSGEDLVKVLTWIAQHPSEGKVITSIEELGVEGAGTEDRVRERMQWYAMKFVAKVTGRMDR
jgi:hypothetical protein